MNEHLLQPRLRQALYKDICYTLKGDFFAGQECEHIGSVSSRPCQLSAALLPRALRWNSVFWFPQWCPHTCLVQGVEPAPFKKGGLHWVTHQLAHDFLQRNRSQGSVGVARTCANAAGSDDVASSAPRWDSCNGVMCRQSRRDRTLDEAWVDQGDTDYNFRADFAPTAFGCIDCAYCCACKVSRRLRFETFQGLPHSSTLALCSPRPSKDAPYSDERAHCNPATKRFGPGVAHTASCLASP